MNNCNKKNIIVIGGPTASGKTRLAVAVAQYCNGEIISADSRQVYRQMTIGTGKDLNEYTIDGKQLPYHLIDIADPHEMYTLYDYKRDFYQVYSNIVQRGKFPVLSGGTGLYIEAVLRNYDIPAIPENPQLRDQLMKKEKDLLINDLEKTAPDIYSKTDLSSKKRIVRALEVALCRSSTTCTNVPDFPVLDPIVLCTRWDRSELRKRIDVRLHERLDQGLVGEVKLLLQSGIPRERFSLFGMEYKHVAQYIDGDVSYEKMVEDLKISIHQLAKRQETWFRGMERRGIPIHWIDNADQETALALLNDITCTPA
jgi:tRNA dimethylallyltransferase